MPDEREHLVFKLNEYLDGRMSYSQLQDWLDRHGGAKLGHNLPSKERLYYSWLRQSLDMETTKQLTTEDNEARQKEEVRFFIRILRGQVGWWERAKRWWNPPQ